MDEKITNNLKIRLSWKEVQNLNEQGIEKKLNGAVFCIQRGKKESYVLEPIERDNKYKIVIGIMGYRTLINYGEYKIKEIKISWE